MPLRRDHDAGDELQPRQDRGHVAEENEDLVELVLDAVRADQVSVRVAIGAENVIVRHQVGETELPDALGVRAHGRRVGADLGLREDRADPHRH